MATISNGADLRILDAIERWHETALGALNDIDGWRGAEEKRRQHTDPSRRWVNLSQRFSGDTFTLAAMLRARELVVAPMLKLYEAIVVWFETQSAAQLPEQSKLWALMDAAGMNLNLLRDAIYRDASPTEAKPRTVAPAPKGEGGRPEANRDIAEFVHRMRSRKPPMPWKQIPAEWKRQHPRDGRCVSVPSVRSLYARYYPR